MRTVPPCMILLAALTGCGGEDAGSFEALTYNVAGLPEGISRSEPEKNTPKISVRINAYDLVLVQEDFSYHHLLTAAADHPYRSAPLEDFATLVNDGLNRFSRFPLGPVERERWPACFGTVGNASDCLSSKGWSLSEVRLTEDVILHVYNHHAEAGGGPQDVAARNAGFARLTEAITERSAGFPVIVGGDTNLHGDDEDDRPTLDGFLEDNALTDACRSLTCGDDRIDRFFFRSGGGVTLTAEAWSVADEMVDEAGEPLSDHLGIRTRFGWRVD